MTSPLFAFLRSMIRKGTLNVVAANGCTAAIGDGTGKQLGVRFKIASAERRLILNPELAFGEIYAEGLLVVTNGTLYDVVELVARNLALDHPRGIAKLRAKLRQTVHRLSQSNSKKQAKRNVAHHYNIDRRIYDLFLDEDRQYSCAYFEYAGQSLEDAQRAKKRHIAAKLLLKPGQGVLDIGGGWGGLARYLAGNFDVDVTGITLSEEQLDVSRQSADAHSTVSNVHFELLDYRAVNGIYDRVVSVGMFEHVGLSNYDTFFETFSQRLAIDGIGLLHTIGRTDGVGPINPWIEKYIFPGGYVPALSEMLPSIERSGLIATDIEVLRLHYAETLRIWRQRFVANRSQAIALTDERFFRMWEFYLATCECGFRFGGLTVFQIQVAKQLETVPLTRNYIAEAESESQSIEWSDRPVSIAAE